jgi:hypothetical protein
MNTPQTDDEPNEFAALESFDMIAAFLHQKYGEAMLREAFALIGCHREQLEKAAEVLEQRGLDAVASIMREIAAEAPSGIEANPYDPDSINGRCWRWSWWQKQRQASGEIEEHLRRQKPRYSTKPSIRRH